MLKKILRFKIQDFKLRERYFKQGKNLVITPSDYIQLIEWNTKADYEALEDNALMTDPIEVIGELDSGFFARKFMLKVIISDLKVGVA